MKQASELRHEQVKSQFSSDKISHPVNTTAKITDDYAALGQHVADANIAQIKADLKVKRLLADA